MITTIKEFKIFESKNIEILYHFTSLYDLNNITNNYTDSNPVLKPTKDDYFNSQQYSISTTRKYNFIWESIRITLNGISISSNYKIKPLEFFNNKELTDYNYNHRDVLDKNLIRQGKQFEERIIFAKESDKLNLKKYCLSIDIATDEIYDFNKDNALLANLDFEKVKTYFDKLNIQCNLVKKFKPYK